jgi:hypothetical protein
MRIASYHTNLPKDADFPFWITDVAIDLVECISNEMDAEFIQAINFETIKGKWGIQNGYDTTNADISFVRMSSYFPNGRPNKFLVAVMGDYTYYKEKVHDWIKRYRPELILCTDEIPLTLKEVCNNYGSKAEWMPYFLGHQWQQWGHKCHGWTDKLRQTHAFISGCIGKNIYHIRKAFHDKMRTIGLFNNDLKYVPDNKSGSKIKISCNETFGKYPMSFTEYKKILCDTRYYVTGGIMDRIVPSKVFEASLLGACMVCNPMDNLKPWGFVNGKTIITIDDPGELLEIFRSDKWKEIGPKARDLVLNRHTVQQRAKEVADIIRKMI